MDGSVSCVSTLVGVTTRRGEFFKLTTKTWWMEFFVSVFRMLMKLVFLVRVMSGMCVSVCDLRYCLIVLYSALISNTVSRMSDTERTLINLLCGLLIMFRYEWLVMCIIMNVLSKCVFGNMYMMLELGKMWCDFRAFKFSDVKFWRLRVLLNELLLLYRNCIILVWLMSVLIIIFFFILFLLLGLSEYVYMWWYTCVWRGAMKFFAVTMWRRKSDWMSLRRFVFVVVMWFIIFLFFLLCVFCCVFLSVMFSILLIVFFTFFGEIEESYSRRWLSSLIFRCLIDLLFSCFVEVMVWNVCWSMFYVECMWGCFVNVVVFWMIFRFGGFARWIVVATFRRMLKTLYYFMKVFVLLVSMGVFDMLNVCMNLIYFDILSVFVSIRGGVWLFLL